MKTITVCLLLLLAVATCAAQEYPAYIFVDGSGNPYPSGSGQALSSNPPYAECYTNVSGQPVPCDFGAGSNVVISINGTSGAFTFNGAAVSCTGTTCTFTGVGTGSSVTVNGGASLPAANFVNNTGAGEIDFTNPSGSTINATLHNTTVTLGSTSVALGATASTVTGLGVDGATSTEIGYVSGVTSGIQGQLNLKAPIATPTFTGKVTTAASAAGGAGFNLPAGTAPTAPVNGDLWTTTTGVYAQINGVTVGPFGSATTVPFSGLTAPSANTSIAMSTYTANFNFTGNWGSGFGYSISSNASNASTGPLFELSTGASTSMPVLLFGAQGIANGVEMDSTGSLAAIGTGSIVATKATNLAGTSVDSVPYQSGSATTGYVASPTANGVYAEGWNITGSVAAAPVSFQITGAGVSCTGTPLVCTFTGGTGSGTVVAAAQYDISYYTQAGTTAQVGGAAINGFQFDSTTGAPAAATAAQLGTLAAIPQYGIIYSAGTTSALTNITPPTTSGHTFVAAWQPSGSAVAPIAFDITSYLTNGTVTSVGWTGGIVTVATGTTTPAFTIAGTSGGIPYFSGAATWASSGALTHYGVVYGGGAAGAPVSTAADTTTTHALFATATAPAFRALAYTDLPALSANQVLGALTATTPSGLSMPSCSGATNALIWTSGTGFGCNTISAGTGTVTVVGAGSLGSTQFVTGGGTTTVQTPSSVATLDASGNAVFASVTSTPITGDAGMMSFASNTANPTLTTGDFSILGAPSASVTAFAWQVPTATNASAGILHVGANSAAVSQLSVSQLVIGDIATASLAGSGAALVTGPTSSTSTDLVSYTGTAGQTQDSGILSTNVTQTTATPAANQICVYGSTAKTCTPTTALPSAAIPIVPTVVDTSTPITVSTTLAAEQHFNEHATAATAMTYNLPTAAAGKQFCFTNAYNGSAANTGTLELLTSASGQFIIFTDGTLSATGGYVISGGAAADAACVSGVDSTHWMLYVQRGTWTKH
jgi:hypothetical protein